MYPHFREVVPQLVPPDTPGFRHTSSDPIGQWNGILRGENKKAGHLWKCSAFWLVPPPGIEPGSQPSEGRILSVEIQRGMGFRCAPEPVIMAYQALKVSCSFSTGAPGAGRTNPSPARYTRNVRLPVATSSKASGSSSQFWMSPLISACSPCAAT